MTETYSDLDIGSLVKEVAQQILVELRGLITTERTKEWYSTDELARAMNKSPFTVREHWCNAGRIECEKDPDTGKWRIPGEEYVRLLNGGLLQPKR